MARFKIKDRSTFPPPSDKLQFKPLLVPLREGKHVEISVDSRAEAIKVRRSLIASMSRWLTNSEALKTSISDARVSAILTEKSQ